VARRKPLGGAIAFFVVAALGVSVGLTAPAFANPTFPTWQEVQAAKRNVVAKKAEIAKLLKVVASLQAAADDAGRTALIRGEEATIASANLDDATATANRLQAQADAAQSKATDSAQRAAQLVAQLARDGGSNLTLQLLLDGHNAGNLLESLGTMSKLSQQSASIYQQAQADANSSRALTDQAKVAQDERAKLAAVAQAALDVAQQASADAEARVAVQKKQSTILYAQLASLRGTSAAVQKKYLEGIAWEKAQEAIKNPPPPAPPVNPTPPLPDAPAVAGAIRFAEAHLGEPYVFGGMGPNVWDCSGLTKASYAHVGVYIGIHGSNSQYNYLRDIGRLVPLNQMVAGDLLWYSAGGSPNGLKYHVTLYIGSGLMIEAPYPGSQVRIRAVRYGDLVPYAGRPTP
jgi:cell wall-associated NlpC family hydrolase